MRFSPSLRAMILLILALDLAPPASAQVDFFTINKRVDYLQDSPSAPTVNSANQDPNPYTFDASIHGSNITGLTPTPTVTLTNSTVVTLNAPGTDGENKWHIASQPLDANYTLTNFATQGAMDAAFPNGNYTLNVGGPNVTLNLSPDSYPFIPQLSNGVWAGSSLVINPYASYDFNFNTFAAYASGGVILLNIDGPGVELQQNNFSTNSDPLITSYTLGADILQPNTSYVGVLSFGTFTATNTTAVPGALGFAMYRNSTSFTITTIPEPSLASGLLGAGALFAAYYRRRRR